MKTYTVHFPKGAASLTADALTGAVLIRDGFSWGAFLFGPFWLFWNRLWLTGFVILVLELALSALFAAFDISQFFTGLINLAVMILFGLEGNSLKRWTFERRGRPVAGMVCGHDETEAEAKMLADGLDRMQQAAPVTAPPSAPVSPVTGAPAQAFGLFPLLERPK